MTLLWLKFRLMQKPYWLFCIVRFTLLEATDRSKAVLLLWIFYVFVLSCVCYVLCASVYMCFVVTCWERADLLALVCGVFCEFVTFPLVSWVRCGTWLYRFLIFAPLFTFNISDNFSIRPWLPSDCRKAWHWLQFYPNPIPLRRGQR